MLYWRALAVACTRQGSNLQPYDPKLYKDGVSLIQINPYQSAYKTASRLYPLRLSCYSLRINTNRVGPKKRGESVEKLSL
jgi:hypothetical protein